MFPWFSADRFDGFAINRRECIGSYKLDSGPVIQGGPATFERHLVESNGNVTIQKLPKGTKAQMWNWGYDSVQQQPVKAPYLLRGCSLSLTHTYKSFNLPLPWGLFVMYSAAQVLPAEADLHHGLVPRHQHGSEQHAGGSLYRHGHDMDGQASGGSSRD